MSKEVIMERVTKDRVLESQNNLMSFLPFSMFLIVFLYLVGLRVSPVFSGLMVLPLITYFGLPLLGRSSREQARLTTETRFSKNLGLQTPTNRLSRQGKELVLFRIARKHNGILTIPTVTLESGLALDEVEELMQGLYARGYCECLVDDQGSVFYRFPDFIDS